MRKMEGWKVIEETDEKLVLEKYFPGDGKKPGCLMRVTGNPNPDMDKHREINDRIYRILMKGHMRRLAKEREEALKSKPATAEV